MLRRPAVMGQMVVYGQTMRDVEVNGIVRLSLTMDSIGGSARESSLLKAVTVRFDKHFLQDFALLSITPPALSKTTSGSGQYFVFAPLPRETPIAFQFKALRAGRHKMEARVTANLQLPNDYVATIIVAPKTINKTKQ